MKNAKRWYIFWNVVRAASMVIILINAFILYRSGESIVVSLAGEQQGAIFWVLQFTANIFLPILRDRMKEEKEKAKKETATQENPSQTKPS